MDEREEKLNEYIRYYCADKTSDLDFAIGQLSTAIGTFEREAKKRKAKVRQQLLDNFENAYNALREAKISVSIAIDPSDNVEDVVEYGVTVGVEIDDFLRFAFGD